MRERIRLAGTVLALVVAPALLPSGAGAGTLEEVKARKKLVVGTAAVYEPFEFKKEGRIIGYDVDIVELFGKDLGVPVELVDVAFSGIVPGLISKRFDMIQSGVSITKERLQRVSFSIPYADASRVLVVKQTRTDMAKPEDVTNKIVAVELGTATERFLRAFEKRLKEKGQAGLKDIKTYEQLSDAYLDLGIGRVDAVLDTKPHALTMMRKKPGEYRAATPVGERRYFAGVFRKDDGEFLNAYNAFMTRIRKDGTLDELQKKWFGYTFGDLPWEPVAEE